MVLYRRLDVSLVISCYGVVCKVRSRLMRHVKRKTSPGLIVIKLVSILREFRYLSLRVGEVRICSTLKTLSDEYLQA